MKKISAHKKALPAILGGNPRFEKPVPIISPTMPPLRPLLKGYESIIKSTILTNARYEST
jgi:hypothetical protein